MRAIDAGILICTECHELNKQDADTDEQTCTRCGAWFTLAVRTVWPEPGPC
jgi:uncharacterized paraquat-inducible protein A